MSGFIAHSKTGAAGILGLQAGEDVNYGEALLAPTVLYSPVTEVLAAANIPVHYSVNITGHGWRKLLRHAKPFTYRITKLPPVPPVLEFIQEQAQLSDREAYSTFNMGAGFALFMSAEYAPRACQDAEDLGIGAYIAGIVEEGPKQLLVEPLGIRLAEDDLQPR
jgi:phosphoribosylformylglycinamidine cyclo-ligase